jgi:hypothetical protein
MPLIPRRRWFQFSLRSLLGLVVVICLTLGGWHLLMTYGQWVEAEPAVVGQPIKIHGRFFHFFAGEHSGRYELLIARRWNSTMRSWGFETTARQLSWWRYDVEYTLDLVDKPTDFSLTLVPNGGSPIRGTVVVHPAE